MEGGGRGYNAGYNTINASAIPNCPICGGKGHIMRFCTAFKHGEGMRQQLRHVGKCDQCLVDKDKHGSKCTGMYRCKYCHLETHKHITCDGSKDHPGSWLLRKQT